MWLTTARAALASVLPLLLLGCVTNPAQGTHDRYLASWSDRLDQYRVEFTKRDNFIRERSSNFLTELNKSPAPTWQHVAAYAIKTSTDIHEAFVIAGRGEMIKAYMEHIKTQPSPGLSDIWFQQRADDLKDRAIKMDRMSKEFLANIDAKISSGPEWMATMEYLSRENGLLEGKQKELESLYKQAYSYHLEKRQALVEQQEQAKRAAQALMAASLYLNQINYQNQLINTLNRPRTCTVFNNMVTCY